MYDATHDGPVGIAMILAALVLTPPIVLLSVVRDLRRERRRR